MHKSTPITINIKKTLWCKGFRRYLVFFKGVGLPKGNPHHYNVSEVFFKICCAYMNKGGVAVKGCIALFLSLLYISLIHI